MPSGRAAMGLHLRERERPVLSGPSCRRSLKFLCWSIARGAWPLQPKGAGIKDEIGFSSGLHLLFFVTIL